MIFSLIDNVKQNYKKEYKFENRETDKNDKQEKNVRK